MNRVARTARVLWQQRTHRLTTLPVVIVNLNDICNSRCLSCAIWQNNERLREPGQREMSDRVLDDLYREMSAWRPIEVLLSGGEPTMHPRFGAVVGRLRGLAPVISLATNGLSLDTLDPGPLGALANVFVSFDAPDSASYREIRGVDGFERMVDGIRRLRSLGPRPRIVARCTLQRENVARLPELVDAARETGCDQISFLAVDTTSEAFGRRYADHAVDNRRILPAAADLGRMQAGIDRLEQSGRDRFIESGVGRLRWLYRYFRALADQAEFPPVRCNAPWVSAVIETNGDLRPCFFHPVVGRLGDINGARAVGFRRALDVSEDATCRRCVCSKELGVRSLLGA